MSNESLIQVPSNVDEPLVLQRFLLRLVEELDIVLGKRASSSNDQYVAQKDLLTSAANLEAAIASAQERLDEATSLLEQTVDNNQEDVSKSIEELEQVNSTQSALINRLENFSWFRPFTATFPGRNTNGTVTPSLEYNITSITRSAIGVYNVVLVETQDSSGNDLLARTQELTSFDIADSATSEYYTVEYDVTSVPLGTFTIKVFAIEQGAGSKLQYVPYDPLTTDSVTIAGMYTPTGLTLP